MFAAVTTDWSFKNLECGIEPTILTTFEPKNSIQIEPYSGIVVDASIVRAYSQIKINTYAEDSEYELEPFLLHHTTIKMSPAGAEAFALQLGEKAST